MDDRALGNSLEAQLVKAAIASGVGAVSVAAHALFRARGAFEALAITRDIAYGSDPAQRFDVWRPRGRAAVPRPLVVFLHGGGFQHLDRGSHWAFAERFAQAGAVVVNADYRLAPAHRYPAAAEDAAAVYRHALAHARALGADPSAIVVAGTSAGANLALGLAVTQARARTHVPRACVLFSGLLQVSDIARLYRARRIARPLRARIASIACDYVGTREAWRVPARPDPRLDPLLDLELSDPLPPMLPAVFSSSGSQDAVLGDSLRLQARLTEAGHPCRLDVVEGAGHAFQGLIFQARVRALWERCFAFLRAQGIQLVSTRSSDAAS